jgi:plastocyanin
MTQKYVQLTFLLAVILLHIQVGSVAAGTLSVKVIDITSSSGFKDAVVWAEPVGPIPAFAAPVHHAEMIQVNLAFTPSLLPVLVGTTVDFPNRDTVYHSVFSFSRQQRFEIGLYGPGEIRSVTFHKVGLAKLFCNIHDQMRAFILVLPTPYFSTTEANGGFTIAKVPAGDYTVKVWNDRLQAAPQRVSVSAEGTTDLAFALRPKRRGK